MESLRFIFLFNDCEIILRFFIKLKEVSIFLIFIRRFFGGIFFI